MKLETLWEGYYAHVRNYVRQKISNRADTEDIVQNIFIKAHEGLVYLKDDDKARAWLFQIARNCIVDYYRKMKKTEELPEQQEAEEESNSDYSTEAAADLVTILPFLPEKYREAIELTDLKGMSQKQLSELLGISYSGVKSRVQRGRELIREMMTSCCEIVSDPYGNIVEYRVVRDEPVHTKKSKRKSAAALCNTDTRQTNSS
ncbi:RNA polymerase sigma factor SigZ [Paenibacillus harenae]|uniref:RNA polymerase sigma factor SigZ n=1 Tax=Paenibacillus harenae TaxID=306543 RepID=UPI002793B94C|nr:RNA polymerase sigma factor SigZ [Paenibacillus harenae]MDQ0058767.1 RNA polymerase sigma-70 factor (ECF subfamily) [Paenibacillus harenae]